MDGPQYFMLTHPSVSWRGNMKIVRDVQFDDETYKAVLVGESNQEIFVPIKHKDIEFKNDGMICLEQVTIRDEKEFGVIAKLAELREKANSLWEYIHTIRYNTFISGRLCYRMLRIVLAPERYCVIDYQVARELVAQSLFLLKHEEDYEAPENPIDSMEVGHYRWIVDKEIWHMLWETDEKTLYAKLIDGMGYIIMCYTENEKYWYKYISMRTFRTLISEAVRMAKYYTEHEDEFG